MKFEEKLEIYAQLLVAHGLNVQPNQLVNISTEAVHRDFAIKVAKAAYRRGARHVNLDLEDPRLAKVRILESREEDLSYVPKFLGVKYSDIVDQTGANIKIIGSEDPEILADLDPKKINNMRLHTHTALKHFYDEGIGKSQVHWTIGAAATAKWGKKLFPELNETEACEQLWEEIFKICRVNNADCLESWKEHNCVLQKRAKKLTSLNVRELHFLGPDTDLKVGLSKKAIFKGGSDKSPLGVEFEPNIPTEEVFTTPDRRKTQGKVRGTRPFLINGKLIEGLQLEFDKGKISHFSASAGEDTFREYINSDDGARYLGEVALVGVDSPVFQSGIVFEEILFDENAACHIAVGSAYKFCVDGGGSMGKDELARIGCNESTVHTDMMISSEKVDVSATTYEDETIVLIKNGAWVFDSSL